MANTELLQTELTKQSDEQITVIVQDNHPIHVTKQVQEYWCNWQ